MTLYKVLNQDGSAYHGGVGSWPLPDGEAPGAWTPKLTGRLVPCGHGYHLCRATDLIGWLGPAIFLAEPKGRILKARDKVVVRQARLLRRLDTWTEQTARLFACDCAEHVLGRSLKQPSTIAAVYLALVADAAEARDGVRMSKAVP